MHNYQIKAVHNGQVQDQRNKVMKGSSLTYLCRKTNGRFITLSFCILPLYKLGSSQCKWLGLHISPVPEKKKILLFFPLSYSGFLEKQIMCKIFEVLDKLIGYSQITQGPWSDEMPSIFYTEARPSLKLTLTMVIVT